MSLNVTALILAGSRSGGDDPVAKEAGVSCKALADVGGTPMIKRVMTALEESSAVTRMITSLPEDVVFDEEIERVSAQGSPVRSLLKMLDRLGDDEPILVTTADHALLSPSILNSFKNQYEADRFDIGVAMLPLEILAQKYPAMHRTRLKFKDGNYKSCNLFIFQNKQTAQSILNFWLALEANRKSPWKMIRALGLITLLSYVTGQLTLQNALKRIGKLTNTTPQAIMLDIPEAAIDVDTVPDLEFVRSLIEQKP